ncbi:MAG: DUF493 domain-containing protein [Lentisphaeria bacterium]|nr:DUF493 domain-containing protein [Lentisphaeria bacterium]
MNKKGEEIKFPCQWEFRLIAIAAEAEKTRAAVDAIDKAENAGFTVSAGESSGGGKYQALRVSCSVNSMEHARLLAGKLSKADGVKFMI